MAEGKQRRNIDDFVERIRSRKPANTQTVELFKALQSGDTGALSRAITLVESQRAEDIPAALQLLEACARVPSKSRRIAVTGTPGVGKSTFLNSYVRGLANEGHRVAILSVDPSSYLSRGSILGDKTRMEAISTLDNVYIRPSATGETLGGVHQKTREAILLCEAAGYDRILVETVGVGQSEYMVQRMTDMLILMLLPGGGDELQGIKKGIMETADVILINKVDQFEAGLVQRSVNDLNQALHLAVEKSSSWTPRILPCSALQPDAVEKVSILADEFFEHAALNGSFADRRQAQWKMWFDDSLGWAVKEVLRQQGRHLRDYMPGPDELPPAKAMEMINSLFR